jgi:HEAT repeat protein
MRRFLLALLVLAPLLGMAIPAAEKESSVTKRRITADGPALLDLVRKRFAEVDEARIKALIEQMGDDSFLKRQEASAQLVYLGERAKTHLRRALKHDDLEIRYRAAICLKEIEKDEGLAVLALRMLMNRKPSGTTAVLFDLLPRIDDELAGEVREALVELALKDSKPDPILVAGLKDKFAARRAAAAVALCRAKANAHLPAIRKLLDDPDVKVRLPVALALVRMRHKEGMPVLLAVMEQPPTRETGLVEDMLFHLAGEKSPVLAGSDTASRKKYRQAWEAWWKDHGAKIDLAVLEEHARYLGHTTVVLLDVKQVVDLDASNRVRWTIDNIQSALDVQRLPGEKVLLAEYGANRVTERDSKGTILWEKAVPEPLVAQRLANGNTFIANSAGLIEVDRDGKEVFNYNRPAGEEIKRARKLPGGDILLITELGVRRFVRIDRFGKQIKSFGVEVETSGGRIDLTAAGNVLIPELHNHRVVEFDMNGKIVRSLAVQQPITAAVLPNGHILVTSMSQKRAIEFDRAGKEVWEYKRDTRVTRAVRH